MALKRTVRPRIPGSTASLPPGGPRQCSQVFRTATSPGWRRSRPAGRLALAYGVGAYDVKTRSPSSPVADRLPAGDIRRSISAPRVAVRLSLPAGAYGAKQRHVDGRTSGVRRRRPAVVSGAAPWATSTLPRDPSRQRGRRRRPHLRRNSGRQQCLGGGSVDAYVALESALIGATARRPVWSLTPDTVSRSRTRRSRRWSDGDQRRDDHCGRWARPTSPCSPATTTMSIQAFGHVDDSSSDIIIAADGARRLHRTRAGLDDHGLRDGHRRLRATPPLDATVTVDGTPPAPA